MIDFVALKIVTGEDTFIFYFINCASRWQIFITFCKKQWGIFRGWRRKRQITSWWVTTSSMSSILTCTATYLKQLELELLITFPLEKVILVVNIPCWSMFISVFLQFCRLSFLKPSWTKSWRKHSAIETILVIMFLISGVCNNICVWQWPR